MVFFAAAAAFTAASVQSATGFGFALLLGPVLFAVLDPGEALTALLLLGVLLNLLVLSDTGAWEHVRWRELAPLLAAAVPGLAAGVVLLVVLPKAGVQVAVGLAVLAAAALQARQQPAPPSQREIALGPACAVGLASGALTTSTSVSGPPLVLWLRARGLGPAELRASLAAAFLALNFAGAVALLAADAPGGWVSGTLLLLLAALVAAGHVVGRWVFSRLDRRTLSTAVLILVAVAGAASVVAGVAGS